MTDTTVLAAVAPHRTGERPTGRRAMTAMTAAIAAVTSLLFDRRLHVLAALAVLAAGLLLGAGEAAARPKGYG